jgi:hypothetical protein
MSYGPYLRSIRKAARLSQVKLADEITKRGHPVTDANISMIEREYDRRSDGSPTQPNKTFVILAAEICGADVNASLVEADYAPLDSADPDGLYAGLNKLPPDVRPFAKRQIKALMETFATEEHPNTDYIDDEEK